jgi:hypothetical protein
MVERVRVRSPFLPPVLITESADAQEKILKAIKAIEQEIKPVGIIERRYVADYAASVFEIARLRRCKTAILNISYRPALEILLARLLREPGQDDDYVSDETQALALAWFTDEKAREQVRQILRRFHLDESAIEAQAYQLCASQLELIDRQLASLERRQTALLSYIAEYRVSLAWQLKESAERIINAQSVLRLEHASSKKSAA